MPSKNMYQFYINKFCGYIFLCSADRIGGENAPAGWTREKQLLKMEKEKTPTGGFCVSGLKKRSLFALHLLSGVTYGFGNDRIQFGVIGNDILA